MHLYHKHLNNIHYRNTKHTEVLKTLNNKIALPYILYTPP